MIEIITYDGKTVKALNDALLYDGIIGNDVILSGMEMAELGGVNFSLDINAGYGVIQGRVFKFNGGSVEVDPPTSGSTQGQIIIQVDLSNDAEPIKIFSDNTMRSLRKDENFNIMSGVWETQYCTYNVYESGTVAPTYPQTMKVIEPTYRTQSNLATLQETVTNYGTRINNQANRLTTLESKQYEYSIRNVSKANITIPANGTKQESITISLASDEKLIGWVDKWVDGTGTSSSSGTASCIVINWWGSGNTRLFSVRNFATSQSKVTVNLSALVRKKV